MECSNRGGGSKDEGGSLAELKAALAVETTALAAVTSKKQDSRATTVAVAATMMKGLAPGERK